MADPDLIKSERVIHPRIARASEAIGMLMQHDLLYDLLEDVSNAPMYYGDTPFYYTRTRSVQFDEGLVRRSLYYSPELSEISDTRDIEFEYAQYRFAI